MTSPPATYDKLHFSYSRDKVEFIQAGMSCNHPKEEENSDCKPTVTVMANELLMISYTSLTPETK